MWLYRHVALVVPRQHATDSNDANVLANSRVDRFVSIPANSTVDTAFAVASSLHVAVSDLKADLTVDFRDAEGTPHSVSASFSGFGYWDY